MGNNHQIEAQENKAFKHERDDAYMFTWFKWHFRRYSGASTNDV